MFICSGVALKQQCWRRSGRFMKELGRYDEMAEQTDRRLRYAVKAADGILITDLLLEKLSRTFRRILKSDALLNFDVCNKEISLGWALF